MIKRHYDKSWEALNSLEQSMIQFEFIFEKLLEKMGVSQNSDTAIALKQVFKIFYGECTDKFDCAWKEVIVNHPQQRFTDPYYVAYASVEEDPASKELYITFPGDLIEKLEWKEGDILAWEQDGDAFILSKKTAKQELT
jgi:hypothetical protein